MPLIESLGQVKGLLCAKAEQAIGMPLKLRKVVKRGWLHPLRLGRKRRNCRFPWSTAEDDAVGFLAIGRQSRCVCRCVVVVPRPWFGTEPGSRIAFLGWILPTLKCGSDLNVILGDEVTESNFPINDYGQGRRLHPPDREFLIVDNRIGTRKIHADKPIRSASAAGCVRQSIVLAPWTKLVEPVADGVWGQ